jgi:hypothetical protein
MKKAVLPLAALAMCACEVNLDHPREVQHANESVELDKAEMAKVEIKMGVGELLVDGGSPKLMDGDFTYSSPSRRPLVHYDSSSFRGHLSIEQPSGAGSIGQHGAYKWDLRLNNDLPMDLVAHLGVGESRLNLGSLSLRSLEVHIGVGEVRVDLRGNPKRDYDVEIHGGVGQATVYLPASVGVDAFAAGGIGSVTVRGLEKRGGRWINPAHEHAPVTIHMDLKGGVGDITMIAE